MTLLHALAAFQAVVSGVLTADGEPVAKAKVAFTSATRTYDATTGTEGTFSLEIAPGTYSFSAERRTGKQILTMEIPKILLDKDTVLNLSWPKGTDEERSEAIRQAFSQGGQQLSAGAYDRAIETFRAGLDWDATQPGLWAVLALAYTGKADYKSAAFAASNSIRFAPENAGYRNNLAGIYFRMGDYDAAAQRYREASELNPAGRGLYLSNLGACYYTTGKYAEAAAAYRDATGDANVPPSSWFFLATCNEKTNNIEGAVSAYQRYLQSAPNGTYAAQARARLAALGR